MICTLFNRDGISTSPRLFQTLHGSMHAALAASPWPSGGVAALREHRHPCHRQAVAEDGRVAGRLSSGTCTAASSTVLLEGKGTEEGVEDPMCPGTCLPPWLSKSRGTDGQSWIKGC